MTKDTPRIVRMNIHCSSRRVWIPFLEASPPDYSLDYDIEVEISPKADEERYPRRASRPGKPEL